MAIAVPDKIMIPERSDNTKLCGNVRLFASFRRFAMECIVGKTGENVRLFDCFEVLAGDGRRKWPLPGAALAWVLPASLEARGAVKILATRPRGPRSGHAHAPAKLTKGGPIRETRQRVTGR